MRWMRRFVSNEGSQAPRGGGDEPDDVSGEEVEEAFEPELSEGAGASRTSGRREIGRHYLEFREGTSAKFYAVVHVAHGDGTESVAFNFGRIGHPREWDEKARHVDPAKAAAVVDDLLGEKRRKGYIDAPWPASLSAPEGAIDAVAPPFIAGHAGTLPDAGPATVAGIDLPAGRRKPPGMAIDEGADAAPTLWLTAEPVADVGELWVSLAAAFPATGLWPLVVEKPELDDVLGGRSELSRRIVAEILEAAWGELSGDDEDDDEAAEDLAPYRRDFPGIAPATTGADDRSAFAGVARGLSGHLGLVAVERPADAVAEIGWLGWANYDLDPGEMAAVFRSWEERFGAVLVGLAFDVLTFGVSRPARNLPEATAIAAEHTAICPDNVWQGAGTLVDYARDLVRSKVWSFWWD